MEMAKKKIAAANGMFIFYGNCPRKCFLFYLYLSSPYQPKRIIPAFHFQIFKPAFAGRQVTGFSNHLIPFRLNKYTQAP
jgi:hypothetical protein